jgi:hypothetical protein
VARKTSQDPVARPKTARREALWLKAVEEHYLTPQEIAEASGLSVRQIQRGLKRARGAKLDFWTAFDVEWIMNSNPFMFEHQCEWHNYTDIPRGVKEGCLYCLRAGLSHLMNGYGQPVTIEAGEKPRDPQTFAQRKFPVKPPKRQGMTAAQKAVVKEIIKESIAAHKGKRQTFNVQAFITNLNTILADLGPAVADIGPVILDVIALFGGSAAPVDPPVPTS